MEMPQDFAISIAAKPGTDVLLSSDQGDRRHPMPGFDDSFADIVDYIVRITHRIWEEKDIGHIYDTYRHNCRVTDDYGLQYGRDKIVADTVHTINAFPDGRLYADEVIWAGDDEQGFVTSHRALNMGDHTGHWRWGRPTHRRLNTWVIANCVIKDNEIYEEWVLYNTAAKLQQLGLDVAACAREFGNSRALRPYTEREQT
jgi:hypothetical protein